MTQQDSTAKVSDGSELDSNSLAAIRNLIDTEETVEPQPVKESRQAKPAQVQAPTATPKSGRFAPLPSQDGTPAQSKAKRQRRVTASNNDGIVDRLKAAILGYRPTAKHIVLGSIALLVFFRPWLVLGLLFLFAFVVTGIFLIFGYDGFWRQVMNISRWYARRHPSRSAEIHRKLDNFAMKFDAFLDRFPEGSVDGLYLPDFGDLAAAEAAHDEALDRRFENLRENEA